MNVLHNTAWHCIGAGYRRRRTLPASYVRWWCNAKFVGVQVSQVPRRPPHIAARRDGDDGCVLLASLCPSQSSPRAATNRTPPDEGRLRRWGLRARPPWLSAAGSQDDVYRHRNEAGEDGEDGRKRSAPGQPRQGNGPGRMPEVFLWPGCVPDRVISSGAFLHPVTPLLLVVRKMRSLWQESSRALNKGGEQRPDVLAETGAGRPLHARAGRGGMFALGRRRPWLGRDSARGHAPNGLPLQSIWYVKGRARTITW